MLCQLVGDFSVERASVLFDMFFWFLKKFVKFLRLRIIKEQLLSILRLRLQLVRLKNDRKTEVSYSGDFFQKMKKWEIKMWKNWNLKKLIKKHYMKLLYEFSSGNQVDGLPLALHKDAVSASCPRSGRAYEHKIYKKCRPLILFLSKSRLRIIKK